MTFRLNRADAVRPSAERKVDDWFSYLMNKELGPMAILHALKRAQAVNGGGVLVEDVDDRHAILNRSGEMDLKLMELDKRRRAMKAAIRGANSEAEIVAILETLNEHTS